MRCITCIGVAVCVVCSLSPGQTGIEWPPPVSAKPQFKPGQQATALENVGPSYTFKITIVERSTGKPLAGAELLYLPDDFGREVVQHAFCKPPEAA